MNTLFVTVDDIAAIMAAGYTVIRVYTGASESDTFTTLDGTITLVVGTESYTYTDADGTPATWYKTCYYGAAVGESDKSAARLADTMAAYASVPELRAQISLTSTTDDVELALLLDAATKAIDNYCNRPDGFVSDPTASARYYSGDGGPYLRIDECTSIASVAVKDSPNDTSYVDWDTPSSDLAEDGDWIPFAGDPERPNFNALAEGKPYTYIMVDPNGNYSSFTSGKYAGRRGFRPSSTVTRGVPTVKVTAKWGYAAAVPAAIKTACIMQAAKWYKRLQGSMASSVASPDMGTIELFRELDPDVKHLLVQGRYVRPPLG